MSPAPMVVTGWSAVSPYGRGRHVFADGVHAGPAPGRSAAGADAPVHPVPEFDAATALGKKGTRSMDRLTALAVTAVGELVLAHPTLSGPEDRADAELPGTALVLGTTTGSAQSMMDFSRSSFTEAKPYLVDPARFPNTVMNCAAGRSAIWYRLRGPNATIGGGRVAGLLALNYARRLQRTGRAERVLCGGAEEWSADRAWLQRQSADAEEGAVLGEGCAMLLVEPADSGSPAVADVLAVEFGVLPGAVADASAREALAAVLRRAFRRAGCEPGDVAVVAPGGTGQERAAIADVLGAAADPREVSCTGLIGDTGAAGSTFQIAAVLAVAERDPQLHGRLALVTAVDDTGVVGCGLLRLLPPAGPTTDRTAP